MDKRKRRVSLLAGILALALVLGLAAGFMPTTAQAATSSELKAQLNNLKKQKSAIETEIKNLKNQIKQNGTEIEKMVSEKNVIDQEIFYLYQQINNTNNQIATYSLLIADKQEELTAAEGKYEKLMVENKERIQAMEEEGELSYWSVLFQANSFADLLDRVNMVQEIAASDRRRLDELNKAAQVVATAKAELEEEKVGLEETKVTLTETQEELNLLDPTEPEAEVAQKIESKSWIGLVLIAGTLTFLLGGALIVRGISRKGRY
jgi:peptidoglycan hydrolase CwlO-like protein